MNDIVKVTVNGKEHELGMMSYLSYDEVIQMDAGGLTAPESVFVVSYTYPENLTKEIRMLPSERFVPENGMAFTVVRRK